MTISAAERHFIEQGVASDIRADGRSRLDYRSIQIETNLLSSAQGSCLVSVACSGQQKEGTRVLATIKLRLVDYGMAQQSGTLLQSVENTLIGDAGAAADDENDDVEDEMALFNCRVDISASTSWQTDNRYLDDCRIELEHALNRLYNRRGIFDTTKLTVVPGRLGWAVDMDISILRLDGNVFDLAFMAARGAMFDLRIPRLKVEDYGSGNIDYSVDDNNAEDQLSIEEIPLLITVYLINNRYVFDPSFEEEQCATASFQVALTRDGTIRLIQMGKQGSIHSGQISDIISLVKQSSGTIIGNHSVALERMTRHEHLIDESE